jgi:site-specific recombinase XerC
VPAGASRSAAIPRIIAVLRATGIRLAELAALRYHPSDPRRSDIDLRQREITVRGKGGKPGSSRSATRPPSA